MNVENIKTPYDILEFLNQNITYGWIGTDDVKRENSMKEFRYYYKTLSIDEILKYKVGTCVEQVSLMKYLFDKIGIKSNMYCTRMYEDENFNDLDAPERMHCFLLYFVDDKVYQLEHPDPQRKGIHAYDNEDSAVNFIVSIYENMMEEEYIRENKEVPENGFKRTTTKFDVVPKGLSYKEFNLYINSL